MSELRKFFRDREREHTIRKGKKAVMDTVILSHEILSKIEKMEEKKK